MFATYREGMHSIRYNQKKCREETSAHYTFKTEIELLKPRRENNKEQYQKINAEVCEMFNSQKLPQKVKCMLKLILKNVEKKKEK